MKKKLLISCLLLAAVTVLSCVATLGVGAAETVTMTDVAAETAKPVAGDTVTISDVTELKAFSAYVSSGGATAGITFRLENDIVLEVYQNDNWTNFNPIGGVYNYSSAAPVAFCGTFDGNGKTVSGLILGDRYVQADGTEVSMGANSANLGFFSVLGEGAVVQDLALSLKTAKNIGGDYFGVLASKASGTKVIGCTISCEGSVYGILNGTTGVAGLLGYAENSVIDGCKVAADVNGGQGSAAGVVAIANNTEIRNCVVSGTYTHLTKAGSLGGVAAKLDGTSSVKNCYSSATLTTTINNNSEYVGGIVGYVGASATVENCFSDASVSASGTRPKIGSLVGSNAGTVKHSFALRDPALDGTNKKHADIGAGTAGVDVSAYQPKTEGGVTSFLLGTVELTVITKPCDSCGGDGCNICAMDGGMISTNAYVFTPATSGSGSLVDALNAWCDDNSTGDVNYVKWAVSGSSIINCDHKAPVGYTPYEGKAPTCNSTGLGDKYCSACKVVLEENAVIPEDESKHSPATYACLAYECAYCHETVAPKSGHKIGDILCTAQECATCHVIVEASVPHTHPEGFDNTDKPCLEYTCAKCGDTRAKDANHNMPEDVAPCKTGIECTGCGMTVAPTESHSPGRAATCTRNQVCLECGDIIRKAPGHVWGDPPTCGTAQICVNCDVENPAAPATGAHKYDRDAADCLTPRTCVYCGHVGQRALGHRETQTASTCGLGRACVRCSTIITAATGDHIVDLDCATVIREAADGRSGIVEGICLDCGRKVEAYTTSAVVEKTGNVLISGGNFTFYTGSRINATFGTVADYKELEYEKGYIPLQVMTISLMDAAGSELALPSGVTIRIALNKSAALVGADAFKLYQLDAENNLVEVSVSGVEEGFLSFTTSSLGTFILVADEKAAFTAIGMVLPTQPEQTAALVGTASYERRDFDI